MTGPKTDTLEFALVVRTRASDLFPLDTLGWRILATGPDPETLALSLRGQSAFLGDIGGEGLLVMVRRDEDGLTLKPLMSQAGPLRDAVPLERMPKAMPDGVAGLWAQAVDTHTAEAAAAAAAEEAAEAAARAKPAAAQGRPRRRPAHSFRPVLTGLAVGATALGILALGYLGTALVSHALPQREAVSARQDRGELSRPIDATELADGGSVRRLQAIAEGLGRRY